MTKNYGLLGRSLSHSFSTQFFRSKFQQEGIDASYVNFELENIEEVAQLKSTELGGLNVTIPYKEAILPYLDSIDPIAERIGAVNCIEIEEGRWIGHNTDAFGFKESLRPILRRQHERALILGSGGASKAVRYVLDELNIHHLTVSRFPEEGQVSYDMLNGAAILQYQFIINTTPLGMFPDVESAPNIPYEALREGHLLYDLTYNPEETLFMSRGRQAGALAVNGLKMLLHQAEEGWRIWNGRSLR